MAKSNPHKRATIPISVRQSLWIAAAGRCEFKGCGKPIGIDFLTGRASRVGEYAHIVSDSPAGPRGDADRSAELAKDEANLMLACFDCHHRIDEMRNVEEYPEQLLLRWKREHEERVKKIYEAEVRTDSLPILVALPIGEHVTRIDSRQVHAAILKNSDYMVHPRQDGVYLDQSTLHLRDGDAAYWEASQGALEAWYRGTLEPKLVGQDAVTHVSIAALAPIPVLMKLGVLVGNKRPAMVLDLPDNKWLWRTEDQPTQYEYIFDVPDTLPQHVFATIDVTNYAANVEPASGATPVVRFSVGKPERQLIGCEAQLEQFRAAINRFFIALVRAGVNELDLLPVTSLCASVEVGRQLLPKTFKRVTVWDYRNNTWTRAMNLVG